MADARCESSLVQEHVPELGFGGDVVVHDLDRDEPLEVALADGAPEIDRRHATSGDAVHRLVAAEAKGHPYKLAEILGQGKGVGVDCERSLRG